VQGAQMRARKIDDLRVKIFLHRKKDQGPKKLRVDSIDDHLLMLKENIEFNEFENIEEIKLMLWVSCQWKCYSLGLLTPGTGDSLGNPTHISSILFSLPEKCQREFLKDLSLV